MNKERQLEKKIELLCSQLKQARKLKVLHCPSCGKGTQISKLVVSRLHYYQIDEWEYADDFRVICPKCDYVARYYDENDNRFRLVKRLLSFFQRVTYHE
jgi:RNase P subunit RPR2